MNLVERAGPDRSIWDIAGAQYGLVTRAQAIRAGMAREAIRWRVRSGRWLPIHRGVYALGPLVHPRAKEMAAVLACGDGAVISHRSAAALWDLCPMSEGDVHVTTPHAQRGHRPGIRPHRAAGLASDEHTVLDRLPVTTPARTLLDLASQAGVREMERAAARAIRSGLVDRDAVAGLLRRHPRRPGASVIRALFAGTWDPALTRSRAEELFLALVRKARLPRPEVNAVIAGLEVDFLWRARGLAAEVDGYRFHSSRDRFERDRSRDAALAAEGFRVMRVTWRQLDSEPEALLVRLAQALAVRRTAGADLDRGERSATRPQRS